MIRRSRFLLVILVAVMSMLAGTVTATAQVARGNGGEYPQRTAVMPMITCVSLTITQNHVAHVNRLVTNNAAAETVLPVLDVVIARMPRVIEANPSSSTLRRLFTILLGQFTDQRARLVAEGASAGLYADIKNTAGITLDLLPSVRCT